MAIRELRFEGDPVLDAIAAPVTVFDDALADLARDMLETMYDAPGRGLAAPQIGVGRRIFVTDVTWKDADPTPLVFVNPTIISASETHAVGPEGCLSIPGRTFAVPRPTWVEMRWQVLDGTIQTARFEGAQAICACHELDHLNGILITQTGQEQ
ncbi:peptide deformylase [Loktanella sp. S4079]|uniref:peptide deformylase n=1 Tax=Loktanella sp. S4079 TaxID=579483 RepID=UPI0005F9CCD7|nr:peptide deformylase [Loktanella sp. S4079]KJZ18886.1 peptide deformylase [Loktanella sp. S4079]